MGMEVERRLRISRMEAVETDTGRHRNAVCRCLVLVVATGMAEEAAAEEGTTGVAAAAADRHQPRATRFVSEALRSLRPRQTLPK